MPRPTAVQFASGSATVVCSTLALLLLTGARSDLWIAAIACLALALGILVAARVPGRQPRPAPERARPADAPATARAVFTSGGAPAARSQGAPEPSKHRGSHRLGPGYRYPGPPTASSGLR